MLSGHFSIYGLVFLVLKSLLGIATQWSHVKFAFMTLKPRSRIFLNTSNFGYFPLTQHHTLVPLVTKPSSLITWTYHEVETAVVYHMQKVSSKSSWQANGTWLFRSFQLKKLLWATEFLKRKGNVFLFQMFQAEIRVPFHRSHLWYQFQGTFHFYSDPPPMDEYPQKTASRNPFSKRPTKRSKGSDKKVRW